jgi:hypothetical protein
VNIVRRDLMDGETRDVLAIGGTASRWRTSAAAGARGRV